MDYLVYVEFNAENLQFYLWYQDYKRRFDALPEREKALSPVWIPEAKETPDLVRSPSKEERRMKRETAVGYSTKGVIIFSDSEVPGSPHQVPASILGGGSSTPSIAPSTVPSFADIAAQAKLKWQPCE